MVVLRPWEERGILRVVRTDLVVSYSVLGTGVDSEQYYEDPERFGTLERRTTVSQNSRSERIPRRRITSSSSRPS